MSAEGAVVCTEGVRLKNQIHNLTFKLKDCTSSRYRTDN
ncbi:hypothetical protein Mic7113_6146 [Allocoleopsis franciscana PCC 7113]|uniref:Uncharacterized protein n=1 Tax=Allocoleopsis franciscana PCC 7113 TaxID=1173027 RepID=K9WNH5_9CYAN|nr:hypothetical protein Mic7113_6146 [Allocoleopsis franciscana PCC 7113]